MLQLTDVLQTPLANLLQGIRGAVFRKMPSRVTTRDLSRDMKGILETLQAGDQYAVVTNRGVPSFLLIPIDRNSWSGLLASSVPDLQYEVDIARKKGGIVSIADVSRPE